MTAFVSVFSFFVALSSATIPPHSLNTNVACGYYTDCTIDCSHANTHIPCAGNQIDGTDAKSLTVICDSSNYLGEKDGYSGCKGTQITCPFTDSSPHGTRTTSCNILCSNPNDDSNGTRPAGCENTFVSSYINRKLDSLKVTCAGTHACKGMRVYAPSWRKSNTNVRCRAHSDEFGESKDACSDLVVHASYFDSVDDWLDLQCDAGQCDGLELRCGENAIPVKKTISKMVYNEATKQYECDDTQCCPLESGGDATATTEAGVVLRSALNSDRKEGSGVSGEMIALIVVSVLLAMMCVVSGWLTLKLHKGKQQNEAGTGFVQLEA